MTDGQSSDTSVTPPRALEAITQALSQAIDAAGEGRAEFLARLVLLCALHIDDGENFLRLIARAAQAPHLGADAMSTRFQPGRSP